ncbi:ATPase [Thraustotheca clavata]|uniref:ATPase n=1 Tax=Thraustotheca clavata TaxID=74557 RepID=A0A1W0A086_9STRA|nr:ATPase [Thraustotheca clavata]
MKEVRSIDISNEYGSVCAVSLDPIAIDSNVWNSQDSILIDHLAGKKRRVNEMEKDMPKLYATSITNGSAFVPKVRLGKRYQAVVPQLKATTSPIDANTRKDEDDEDNDNDEGEIAINMDATPSVPREMYSMVAISGNKQVENYLKFATSLCNGYMHGTSHATVATALQHLHSYNNDITAASCFLYAKHGFTMLPESSAPEENTKKTLKVKVQEWMVRALSCIGHDAITEDFVTEMEDLVQSCPTSELESKEMYVLKSTLERVRNWKTDCDDIMQRKCTISELQTLLYSARDLRCALKEHDIIASRIVSFEEAKTLLFRGMPTRSKGRKFIRIDLDKLKQLLRNVTMHNIHFTQESHLNKIIDDAESLREQITTLLAQEKVSIPAIRSILTKVDSIPVDLQSVVEPLKTKMVSAQKWLDRARKCMPPTKRQSSRNVQDSSRAKMDLSVVHDLVKNAPVDDQSSEMQEMEELLAYADEWSGRVAEAIEESNTENISIQTLRELLEEGRDMPVVMEQTTYLEAMIEAREWALEANAILVERNTLEDLKLTIKDAQAIRKRMHPTSQKLWKPDVETLILGAIEQTEVWLTSLHELLGPATCLKLFTGEISRFKNTKNHISTKPPAPAIEEKIRDAATLFVDVESFITPLKELLVKGVELEALCKSCLADIGGENAYSNASAALEAVDAHPCQINLAEDLRQAVTLSKDWLTKVRSICGAKQTNRRLTKRSSVSCQDYLVDLESLTELIDQSSSLVFRFPLDEQALVVELENTKKWQIQVQKWLPDEIAPLIKACTDLKCIDMTHLAARRELWNSRKLQVSAVGGIVVGENGILKDEAAIKEDSSEQPEMQPIQTTTPVVNIVPLSQEMHIPVIQGDKILDIVRTLSGNRQKEPEAIAAINWSPISEAIDTNLSCIAGLESSIKKESEQVVKAVVGANENEALATIENWQTRLTEKISQSNMNIGTEESRTLHTLQKTLEWFKEARNAVCGNQPHGKIVEVGKQLQSATKNAEWANALFWLLPILIEQQTAMQEWLSSLEERLNRNSFPLEDAQSTILAGEALQADDRILWLELKKSKSWLAKAKKCIKQRQQTATRMTLNAATVLVEDGAKLKVVPSAWTALYKHVSKATEWEARLKASGLDSGQAKIAALVELLQEYKLGGFLVDFDMHRDVLVSATEQYCICRQPYDGLMIGCDLCENWFHDTCIGLSKEKLEKVEGYVCPSCSLLQELKSLVNGISNSTKQLFELEEKTHEKAFSVAMRKVKKEERDVDKAHVAVMELQAQVTAIGQHIGYLEKMQEESPAKFLPSIAIPFSQQPSPMYKTTSFPSAMLRSPYHNHAGASTVSTLPPLQPLPSILHKANGLPSLMMESNPHHTIFQAPPTPSKAPAKPSDSTPPSTTVSNAPSAQEIEITRFKMEHYKLKQLAAEAELTLARGKERAAVARSAVETLISNREVLLPQAQAWWRMACAHIVQFITEKEKFDLKQLKIVATMCEPFKLTFASVVHMQKVLVTIPWTVEAVSMLQGRPKPTYEGLERLLNESMHDTKALAALRSVVGRMDTWISRSKKSVTKFLSASKKYDTNKVQAILNEYMKLPLTCPWGSKLHDFVAELKQWESLGAPAALIPKIDITPPSSPATVAPKRKMKTSNGPSNKRVKNEDGVKKTKSKSKQKVCVDNNDVFSLVMGAGNSKAEKPQNDTTSDGGTSTAEIALDIVLNVILLYSSYQCAKYLYKNLMPMIDDMYSANSSRSKLKDRLEKAQRPVFRMNHYESIIAADLVDPSELEVGFADIGGLEDQKRELYDLIVLPLQHPEHFQSKLLSVPNGILLYGKPGTGKTMLAKAIAKESGAFFINLKVSTLMSKWFGESQKLVKAAFSLAQKLAPCIIFIDEVDSFMGNRSGNASDPTYNSMKTEFMALWDGFTENSPNGGFGVIVLGATNRPADVDSAFLRRMPRTFEVGLPDTDQREKILKVHLRGEDFAADLNLSQLARETEGYSGSDLKELCRAALMLPLREHIESCREYLKANKKPPTNAVRRPLNRQDFRIAKTRVQPTGESAYAYAASNDQNGAGVPPMNPEMVATLMALGMQHMMQAAANQPRNNP